MLGEVRGDKVWGGDKICRDVGNQSVDGRSQLTWRLSGTGQKQTFADSIASRYERCDDRLLGESLNASAANVC